MTSSTRCAAHACIGARVKRCARSGESRHLEEIAFHLFQVASTAEAQRGCRVARACRTPGGRRAGLRGRRRTFPARARGPRARRRRGGGRPGAAGTRRRAAAGGSARERARSIHGRGAARAPQRDDPVLLAEAAPGYAGLGIAIVDLDAEKIARLEAALAALGTASPVLRSRLLARLAVDLYYAPDRRRSERSAPTRSSPRRANRARWPRHSTRAMWRSGDRTGPRSACGPRPR